MRPKRHWWPRLLVAIATILLLLVGIRLWFIDGLVRRVLIDGPSMAPAFCGKHYQVHCADCGFPFKCDAEHTPSDGLAACPNCGFTENKLTDAHLLPADRVIIDRWPLLFREPERGDVVAVRIPSKSSPLTPLGTGVAETPSNARTDLAIKRIVALPGERVAIRGGELFIDDELVRKSLGEWRAARMLVHNNDYRPQKTSDLPSRWDGHGFWRAAGAAFRMEPHNLIGSFDFLFHGVPLNYRHWSCTANSHLRGIATLVRDNDSYNQGDLGRSLNEVADVAMTFRVSCQPDTTLTLELNDSDDNFQVKIRENKAEFFDNHGASWRLPILADLSKGAIVEYGLVDQQWFLIIDNRIVTWQSYTRRPRMRDDTSSPPAQSLSVRTIVGFNQDIEVSDLKVWRDTYYLDPQGLSRDWTAPAPLGTDEYFLLGDNQPVSIDSRHWGGIRRKTILGVVRPRFSKQP